MAWFLRKYNDIIINIINKLKCILGVSMDPPNHTLSYPPPFLPHPLETPITESPQLKTLPTEPHLAEGQIEQDSPRQFCVNIIHAGLTFDTLSTQLWKHLTNLPESPESQEIATKISAFKEEYATYIDLLKGTTWKEHINVLEARLKDNPGDKEAKEESAKLAAFRAKAVHLQEELTQLAAKATCIPFGDKGWMRFGTAGNTSDIDNVYSTDSRTLHANQMLIKLFADTAYTYIFGEDSVSGLQLDIETYLEHPGSAQAMGPAFSGPLSNALFYLELSMVQLAMRKNAFGTSEEGWSKHKEHCKTFHNGPLQASLMQICSDVEILHAQVQVDILCELLKHHPPKTLTQTEIDRMAQKPTVETIQSLQTAATESVGGDEKAFQKAYKLASMAYKAPRLLKLSQQMDEDQRKINALYTDPLRNGSQIRELEMHLIARALLRNTFFDESYFTASAYNIVCDSEGGQLSKRRDEKILRTIEEHREGFRLSPRPISRVTRRPRTPIECIISANENIAQFYAHTHESSQYTRTAYDLAIDSSKYAERITNSALTMLDLIEEQLQKAPTQAATPRSSRMSLKHILSRPKKQILETRLQEIRTQVLALHKIATGLENCKRQAELNDEMNKHFLIKALLAKMGHPRLRKSKARAINTAIDLVQAKFKKGGKYYQQELSLTEKYNLYLTELAKQPALKPYITLAEKAVEPLSDIERVDLLEKSAACIDGDHFKQHSMEVMLFKSLEREGQQALLTMEAYRLRTRHPTEQITEQALAQAAVIRLQGFLENREQVGDGTMGVASPKWTKALDMQLQHHAQMPRELAQLTSGNPAIDTSIRAKVGFSRFEDPEIQALHTQARSREMVQKLGLDSPQAIEAYFQGVESLGDTLLQFAQITEVVGTPTQTQGLALISLWQGTSQSQDENIL